MGNGKGEHQISGVAAEWRAETLPTTWGRASAAPLATMSVFLMTAWIPASGVRATDAILPTSCTRPCSSSSSAHRLWTNGDTPPHDEARAHNRPKSTSHHFNWPIPDELIDWPDSDVRWPPRKHQLHAVDCRTTCNAYQTTDTLRLLFCLRPCRCATMFSV
ncbi:hypothetical protein BN1723_016511 [Verticillium longisporum]|uniref:Uncharacterized protein n=1 Tax=Verticillium longisporum TaxID=100787 RepID=A0A0G4LAT7_VERLO|nr:hypothetical protein BN1708_012502 [Verticillium longisporum]CRK45265.1 hypothetical protein BN1723_016511 [Verticillium longisporum]